MVLKRGRFWYAVRTEYPLPPSQSRRAPRRLYKLAITFSDATATYIQLSHLSSVGDNRHEALHVTKHAEDSLAL